jgi:hypothetical protein
MGCKPHSTYWLFPFLSKRNEPGVTIATVPEEAVVDAVLFDPLAAAKVLSVFASSTCSALSSAVLADFARGEDLSTQRLSAIVAALSAVGVLRESGDSVLISVSADEAWRLAAVLRGVAYAQYRHRDANQVEITLSPPLRPSRLMEVLPKRGFAWAQLFDTKDSLIELASRAQKRLTIITPFLDASGLEWIDHLFEASSRRTVERTLIVRGLAEKEQQLLESHRERITA